MSILDHRAPGPAGSVNSHAAALRNARRFGYAALVLIGGSMGWWSATASISGAVIAPAQFVAENNVKKVQHQQGGIVGELRVREGDRVKEGDLLIRLDDTMARANLQVITRSLDEFAARVARLEAERGRMGEPEVADLIQNESRLFDARATARAGIKAQLGKRIEQLRAEIAGLQDQRKARLRQAEMIQRELVGVQELFRQNLVQITRLSQLEREAAALDGANGQLTAQIAQSEGRIAETELQIIQQTEDLRAEAMKELREIQGRVIELSERRIAAEDLLRRTDIRAPASGYVHQLAVHTVGGVISPAEPTMLIVPSGETLHLEARVAPTDYDQVRVGQSAVIRIHAFNQRTTPEINGSVTRLAADVTREAQTGLTYYTVRISIPKAEVERLGDQQIVAGMVADAFLQTGDRTPLAFLVKPIQDQFSKAFRER
jgi:HlyD family secretion protein